MIIGIQTALMCERVDYDADNIASYIGVRGSALVATSRPAVAAVHIVLHLVTDGQPGAGVVTLSAGAFEEAFDFAYPGELDLTGVVLAVIVPILDEGELRVAVDNAGGRGRPFRVKWRLVFADGAPIRDEPGLSQKMIAAAREAAHMMRESIAGR